MGKKIVININGIFSLNYEAGINVTEIAHDYKKVTGKRVIGAKIDNLLVGQDTCFYEDAHITFIDYEDSEGNKMYQSGLKFLLLIAAKLLWNGKVYYKYSLDKGIYAEFDKKISDQDINDLKIKMREIISDAYAFKKCVTTRKDAITYYMSTGELEKAANIQNIPNRYVELYEINHTYNYFYSEMPWNTSELGLFDLERVSKNSVLLLYPRSILNGQIPEFYYSDLIYKELFRYNNWAKMMGTEYVSELNQIVASGGIQKYIKMNNIMVDDSLYEIAKDIVKKRKDVRMILIGGPSSSGKTTSAYRLCNYLETFGINPIVISADDYYKEREETPKDKEGNYDFECLEALDLKLFNSHLKKLLKGEDVTIPKFNFVRGTKEYTREPIRMEENNVLLIEGIHCLNDKMTSSIERINKYKIFVCPFTPLSLDAHNHLSTTDMRLIRRIVRDNRTRGRNVEDTLENFNKVKEGEEKYIFPFTNDLDATLNTAYAYEIGILRVFAEPLLYSVPIHSIYYEEARRLLGLMRMFYPISSEYIEKDNTLREFIGGSIYEI